MSGIAFVILATFSVGLVFSPSSKPWPWQAKLDLQPLACELISKSFWIVSATAGLVLPPVLKLLLLYPKYWVAAAIRPARWSASWFETPSKALADDLARTGFRGLAMIDSKSRMKSLYCCATFSGSTSEHCSKWDMLSLMRVVASLAEALLETLAMLTRNRHSLSHSTKECTILISTKCTAKIPHMLLEVECNHRTHLCRISCQKRSTFDLSLNEFLVERFKSTSLI